MADYQALLMETDRSTGVSRITLNRPERRNALNEALVAELSDALARAEDEPGVRLVALEGAGSDFCAGADLEEIQASVEAGVLASLADAASLGRLFVQLRRLEKPVVAVVQGRALAGGCGLATACDLIVARDDARFGYPEVNLGFVPAMVMAVLRRAVGERRAFELIALGEPIDAERAREYGLVCRVYPEPEFSERSAAFLAELAERSASALALSKRLLYQIDGVAFEAAIATGAQVNALARMTDDCQAGIRRFLDR